MRAVWEAVERSVRVETFVDANRARDEPKAARRDPSIDPAHLAALTERFSTTQTLLNALEHARRELLIIEARLATAAQLTLAGTASDVDALPTQLDAVVDLDALAQATGELG